MEESKKAAMNIHRSDGQKFSFLWNKRTGVKELECMVTAYKFLKYYQSVSKCLSCFTLP